MLKARATACTAGSVRRVPVDPVNHGCAPGAGSGTHRPPVPTRLGRSLVLLLLTPAPVRNRHLRNLWMNLTWAVIGATAPHCVESSKKGLCTKVQSCFLSLPGLHCALKWMGNVSRLPQAAFPGLYCSCRLLFAGLWVFLSSSVLSTSVSETLMWWVEVSSLSWPLKNTPFLCLEKLLALG